MSGRGLSECTRRDSNPRPSAPEAGGVGDHPRSPTLFQRFAPRSRQPPPASNAHVVTTVVTTSGDPSLNTLQAGQRRLAAPASWYSHLSALPATADVQCAGRASPWANSLRRVGPVCRLSTE